MGRETKTGRFKIRGMHADLHFCRRPRFLSIVEGVNWVCHAAREDHEWVSELNISIQETEVLVVFDYDIEVPCVVRWRNAVVFLAYKTLPKIVSDNGSMGREIPLR